MEANVVEVGSRRRGRKHSDEFRSVVLAACDEPGARASEVAARHGVNVNLVYKWRQRVERLQVVDTVQNSSVAFIPLRVEPAPAEPICVEFCRRDVTVRLSWAASALDDLARLLRGVLQ